jgi:hypothetical protein
LDAQFWLNAIEFVREEGETNALDLARELIGLSKQNFNNTRFDTGDPVTVRAAAVWGYSEKCSFR